MNAKVVFIVESNARNELFFYCLLQINLNFIVPLAILLQTKL